MILLIHKVSISLKFTESDNEMTASEVKPMSSKWCHFHVESYKAIKASVCDLQGFCLPMTPAIESHLIMLRAIFSFEPISGTAGIKCCLA